MLNSRIIFLVVDSGVDYRLRYYATVAFSLSLLLLPMLPLMPSIITIVAGATPQQ
jgi:hypothetical protein